MRDHLPQRPNNVETGIINLDNKDGPGTHWVAYATDPCGIVYFDSYGLAPPVEFLDWQSTLSTQTLTDPPISGRDILNILDALSRNTKIPPHKVVHEYTTSKIAKQYENTDKEIMVDIYGRPFIKKVNQLTDTDLSTELKKIGHKR